MSLRKSQPADLTKNMEIKQRYRNVSQSLKKVDPPLLTQRPKKNVVPIWQVMDLQHREGGVGFSIRGV